MSHIAMVDNVSSIKLAGRLRGFAVHLQGLVVSLKTRRQAPIKKSWARGQGHAHAGVRIVLMLYRVLVLMCKWGFGPWCPLFSSLYYSLSSTSPLRWNTHMCKSCIWQAFWHFSGNRTMLCHYESALTAQNMYIVVIFWRQARPSYEGISVIAIVSGLV